ncbi:MAG: HesA/MoeB/ThiF family protein [Desulfobacterales bacterium]|nr:HesA/MoeB/ThiF family protein [Desulfobacterales bacterium]
MRTQIIEKLKAISRPKKYPDDTDYTSISLGNIPSLATSFKVDSRKIEIIALEEGMVPERYARNMKTFSPEDQASLLKSQVSIVGLGGLGGTVSEILARTGIGTLNLIDGDRFEASNLNRQFLSTYETMGQYKTEAAVKRIKEINASITVRRYDEYLDDKNSDALIRRSDVVVDCLDNITTRFILENASKKAGSPLVSAAVAGLSGHITTIFPEDQGLKLIYGRPDDLKSKGAEASLGCLLSAVSVLAAFETAEVVKIILGRGPLLRNKLLIIDLLDNITEVLDLL